MTEGWFAEQHYILFTETESVDASQRYHVGEAFPGCSVIGLRGWDDLILRDDAGRTLAVPAVPLIPQYVEPCELPDPALLEPDGRFAGKVKWYVQPVVFGGDPQTDDNLIWVTHEQHGELVTWWNERYRELKRSGA
jgi:hypothetical protein